MKIVYTIIVLTLFSIIGYSQKANTIQLNNGNIEFLSEAPLERIEAKSSKLRGVLIPSERIFAFSVENSSFNGFNGSLQKEHFNENYLESDEYPNCTFVGKIVEAIDFTKEGKINIRAKGKLNIHGVEKERIIKVNVDIRNGKIFIVSNFAVLLDDHGISVPTIVNQKIAEEIQISVHAMFDKYE